jgi:hypothetical protein
MKALKSALIVATILVGLSSSIAGFQEKGGNKVQYATGKVASITAGTITILTEKGNKLILKFDKSSRAYSGNIPKAVGELSKGDDVGVKYSNNTVQDIFAGGPCAKHPELPQCHH